MSSTWRRYAKGLVRDDLAAPDKGVNVSILAALALPNSLESADHYATVAFTPFTVAERVITVVKP